MGRWRNRTKLRCRCCLLPLVLVVQGTVQAGILHVRADVTRRGDGSSWTRAFQSLDEALEAARPRDEIWVAAGTYRPSGRGRDIAFELRANVAVYGGFAGNEVRREQRDWMRHVTVLSGDIGVQGDPADNAVHVVIGADGAILDGFTIEGGNAGSERGPAGPGGAGGPARPGASGPVRPGEPPDPLQRGPRPGPPPPRSDEDQGLRTRPGDAARRVGLPRRGARPGMPPTPAGPPRAPGGPDDPNGGGGIHTGPEAILGGFPPIAGGGMVNYQCAPTIRNCTFLGNRAGKGGAAYNMCSTSFPPPPGRSEQPTPAFVNCVFKENHALGRGGAVSNDLGTSPLFLNCVFADNSTPEKGGAMYNDFGCSPTLVNCLFTGNAAEGGGALGNDGGSSPVLYACTFTENHAEAYGPALYQGTGPANNPVLVACVIWGNTCDWEGVAFYNWHDNTPVVRDSIVEGGYPGEGNSSRPPRSLRAESDNDPGYRGTARAFSSDRLPETLRMLDGYRTAQTAPPPRNRFAEIGDAVKRADRVVYVNANLKLTGDGSTWRNAHKSLPLALQEAARDGAEVWVAQGVYLPEGGGRRATFALSPGVRVYGGFIGAESQRDRRDPSRNRTVLSGDIGVRGTRGDNAYHVVTGASAALLDGFTISGGHADGIGYDGKGGGLINCRNAPQERPNHPTVTGFSTEVVACRFVDNYAVDGAAAYSYDRSAPRFVRCTFARNMAENGGAVIDRVGVRATYEDCIFDGNTAHWRGGAVYFDYGARPTIRDCTFTNNMAGLGGAIFSVSRASQLENTRLVLESCTFRDNSARGDGGAACLLDATLATARACVFSENTAGERGDDVYVSGDSQFSDTSTRASDVHREPSERGGR